MGRAPTTLAVESEPRARRGRRDAEALTLVIAWYPHEPRRVGELAVIPPSDAPLVLGRGDGEGPEPRLRLFRPERDVLQPAGPLSSPGLSRRLLLVQCVDGRLRVERLGSAAMRIDGARLDAGELGPGDVLSFRRDLVLYCARRHLRPRRSQAWASYPAHPFGEPDAFGILGESLAVAKLRDEIAFAAAASAHVLITGPSGAGKELAARAIHALSRRGPRALVARNAATLPAGLVDAEIFGNVRNYPNPGMPERRGLVGEADGGTLFLDEIGELPAELQAHLLRVLDAGGEYQRLGDPSGRRSDFRLIAATNRDPGALKHDLLARLTVRVEAPSLDQRREDLPLLAAHLVLRAASEAPTLAARFVEGQGKAARARLSAECVEDLLVRQYPGNVRDLQAVLWRAIATSDGDVIDAPLAEEDAPVEPVASSPDPTANAIRAALRAAGGNITNAAKALGLSSRYALYRWMRKYEITPDESDP